MKLLLVRHPKPDVTPGLCYGQSDVPLVQDWQNDVAPIRAFINKCYPEQSFRYFHSPLSRTRLLAQALHPESEPIEALKEVNFGAWENQLWSDIPREEIDAWRDDLMYSAPYQGESLEALRLRLMAWLEPMIEAEQNMVLVTHSGVIKVLVAQLCQFSMTECFRLNPTYSSITELEVSQNFAMLNRLGAGDWGISNPQ